VRTNAKRMADSVVREVEVVNPLGIHARPSHAIVSTASRFAAAVQLRGADRVADARSILSVMTLGAVQGTRLRIEAQGADAEAAADALAELFAAGFHERGDS